MSLNRIRAVLFQEFFITKDLTVIMDLPFFSIIAIIVFGFMSNFLSGAGNPIVARYFLIGALLWDVIRITQYSMSVEALWNVWSRNLCNMFITPMSLKEYLIAQMISGVIKASVTIIFTSLVVALAFNFNLLSLGILNLLLLLINLVIFSWSSGMIILGIIFRYGTRLQSLAWGLIALLQPLTAAFFPISVLPRYLQMIAYLFPPTYVFEAARLSLSTSLTNWNLIGIAFIENVIYFVISIWFINLMFKNSKKQGQFARNEQ
jgi:ABC-2 type transport system permease protein